MSSYNTEDYGTALQTWSEPQLYNQILVLAERMTGMLAFTQRCCEELQQRRTSTASRRQRETALRDAFQALAAFDAAVPAAVSE